MNLYTIVFSDGSSIEEYGNSKQDILDFLVRSYAHKGKPLSVSLG